MEDRDAARARLKQRIREKRNERGGAEPSENKLQNLLLNVAGNDAEMMRVVQETLKNPSKMLQTLNVPSNSKTETSVSPEEEDEDLPESLKR